MEDLLTADAALALVTLAVMEIVLGVDNLVFISILSGRLPREQQPLARRLGLGGALISRIALLFAITWVMGLTRPLFSVFGHDVSGRDLILLSGGLFLLFKATWEIYDKLEGNPDEERRRRSGRGAFVLVIVQIMLLDVVFSLDSVITAVGMADHLAIMVAAVVIAMVIMLVAMEAVTRFIERHPSIKILALAFLLLIGVMLVAEGMGRHVPKGYIYFGMFFSIFIELLNMRYRKRRGPVPLRRRYAAER